MKKALSFALEGDELIELIRILMDDGAVGGLACSKLDSKARPAIYWKAAEKS